MSICRWSHKSDVYIYQPDGCGEETFVIHVRGKTATEDSQDIPTLEDVMRRVHFKGLDYEQAIDDWKEMSARIKWKPLESVYAEDASTTTTWSVDSVEDLADLLYKMQDDGVRIPPQAFACVLTMLCEKG